MSDGAEEAANALLQNLTFQENFTIPAVNLDQPVLKVPTELTDRMYQKVQGPQVADLTSGVPDGDGVFDQLMAGIKKHLEVEYKDQRITGSEYTKAYIELTTAALSTAAQFTLSKEQAFWEAQNAQIAAVTGRAQLESAKLSIAKIGFEALQAKVAFALGKMKLATDDLGYSTAKYTLTYMLPAQLTLLKEQTEVQRAQTGDFRTDMVPVDGIARRQRELYEEQTKSYMKDSMLKAAKLYTDAWTVQKTVDEGLLPPNNFTNANLDTILNTVRSKSGL